MLAQFIDSSVNFQNGTVYELYGIIVLTLGIIATVMFVSGSRRHNKK